MTDAFWEDLRADMEDPEYRAIHRFCAKRVAARLADEEEE